MEEKRKRSSSLSLQILNKLIPDNLDFNHYTMLSRVSSLMIRQNSILFVECTPVFYRKIGSMVGRHAGGMRRADRRN